MQRRVSGLVHAETAGTLLHVTLCMMTAWQSCPALVSTWDIKQAAALFACPLLHCRALPGYVTDHTMQWTGSCHNLHVHS